jgi:hypothetical protein
MPRKIIQIAARSGNNDTQSVWAPTLYALCDDGTVWRQFPDDDEWYQLSPLPLPDDNPEEPFHA